MQRPTDRVSWLARHGHRLADRGWVLFDVGLAVVLTVTTLKSYTFTATDGYWWIFAAPMIAAVSIRRRWPLLAVALAGVGAIGHHVKQGVGLEALDLAVPLTLYTLATRVRSRRVAVIVLAGALLGVGIVSLLHVMMYAKAVDDLAASSFTGVSKTPGKFADPNSFGDSSTDASVAAKPGQVPAAKQFTAPGEVLGAAVEEGLGVMLILGLAVAVGDGVRSRRAHLISVEQRAADLEREQQQRVALATAAERARITRELHDVVAHGLSVMVVQAQGGAAALERHPDRTAEALQNVISTGRESLTEMRRLLDLVRSDPALGPELTPQLGVGSLPDLVDRVRAAGTPVSFIIDGQPIPLPSSVDLSAYRIAQEALTNTIKHGGAGAGAALRVGFHPNELEIEVRDNGAGGPVPPDTEGAGLRGISERVGMLNGAWSAGPGESGGFRVWARLPLGTSGAPA